MLGSRSRATLAGDVRTTPPGRGRHLRPDVQGLRAIAVIVVVLFHAGLPVSGGFVGVDVFFVISGFVITAMLQREWRDTGRIGFGRFYLRRFRRLTPALALVVAVTVVASLLILSPFGPQQTAAKTGFGALLIAANVVIVRTTGNYFDAPAAGNPLLHMWSLSVEEQFYLAFPLILMVAWTASRRWRARWAPGVAIAAVALVSFGLAWYALGREMGWVESSLIGFYGPGSRAWEFAVGALLALALPRLERLPGWVATASGLLGGAALAASLFIISESTPFPGPWTLLPVGATLLLLASGTHDHPVRRALACRPMVKVGDWSYSIYLWHWPLIVFATVLWPANDTALVVAATVSFVPALVSFYWVETPIRRLRPLGRMGTAALVAVVVLPVLALSAGAVRWSNGELEQLASGDARAVYDGEIAWKDHDFKLGGFEDCTDPTMLKMVEEAPNHEPRCQQSKPGKDVDLALIGDSHVEHLFIGLKEALPDRNIMYFTVNGPLDRANPQYAAAFDYAERTPSINTVLVTSIWRGKGVQPGPLEDILQRLVDRGKTVLLTDDVPDFPFYPYGCKYKRPFLPTTCSISIDEFNAGYQPVIAQLEKVQADIPEVQLLRTAHYLCDETECSMTHGREIFYADPSHLNVIGSEYVGKRMVEDYPVLEGP
jgi:peptidoglycan/LPS O-acetylase OafA/YrhL